MGAKYANTRCHKSAAAPTQVTRACSNFEQPFPGVPTTAAATAPTDQVGHCSATKQVQSLVRTAGGNVAVVSHLDDCRWFCTRTRGCVVCRWTSFLFLTFSASNRMAKSMSPLSSVSTPRATSGGLKFSTSDKRHGPDKKVHATGHRKFHILQLHPLSAVMAHCTHCFLFIQGTAVSRRTMWSLRGNCSASRVLFRPRFHSLIGGSLEVRGVHWKTCRAQASATEVFGFRAQTQDGNTHVPTLLCTGSGQTMFENEEAAQTRFAPRMSSQENQKKRK